MMWSTRSTISLKGATIDRLHRSRTMVSQYCRQRLFPETFVVDNSDDFCSIGRS